MKLCMITWPAIVPTTELEIPDAISEIKKTAAARLPSNGVKVRYAVAISATFACPVVLKTAAAMYIIARLTNLRWSARRSRRRTKKRMMRPTSRAILADDSILGEGGVQVDRVRHDGRADDAHGQKKARGPAQPGHDGVIEH